MTKEEFYKEVNDLRKCSKNKWYQFGAIVEGKTVNIKAYNTWLQIYRVDGMNFPGLMDITVTKFNETLKAPFNDTKN